MATLEEIKAEVEGIKTNTAETLTYVQSAGAKLDQAIALIGTLQNGATPEQLGELLTSLQGARADQQAAEDVAASVAAKELPTS